MDKPIIMNERYKSIDPDILLELNKAGINVLSFILKKQVKGVRVDDKLEIVDYLKSKGVKGTSLPTVERGIRNLTDARVLLVQTKELYKVNYEVLSV